MEGEDFLGFLMWWARETEAVAWKLRDWSRSVDGGLGNGERGMVSLDEREGRRRERRVVSERSREVGFAIAARVGSFPRVWFW